MESVFARVLLMALVLLWTGSALADKDMDRLKDALGKKFPGLSQENLDSLRPAPVRGLYEMVVGTRVVYVSRDGNHMLMGSLIDLRTRKNLTELRRKELLVKVLAGIPEKDMIIMGPKKPKRTMTVFTDVDCQYCAKLHLDVPELVKGGVRIRYLLYPRTGLKSETYRRSVAVWCADDRVEAVGRAKAKKKIEMKTCPNPVADHFKLGRKVGITGTPAIILDDGAMVKGYVPAPRLLKIMGLGSS